MTLTGDELTKKLLYISTKILKDNYFVKEIKKFDPELILLDSSVPAFMLVLIPYKFDVPFIMIGEKDYPHLTRTPIVHTVFPQIIFSSYTDQMNFQQRLLNTLLSLMRYWIHPMNNVSLLSEFVPEKPYVSPIELQTRAQLWIIWQQSVFSYNEPMMPNVKRVGHLHNPSLRELPIEFKTFMNEAEYGVVIVSFGSVIASVPSEIMGILLKAFERTKYKYIIQSPWQNNTSSQFMFNKWLPQFDLLRHKNTKLLISHCGSNSIQEAIIAGVPILGFPVFGDQPANAAMVVNKGFGAMLNIRSFSIEELVSTIEKVTTNLKYRKKIQKASAILRSEKSPVEEAAYWINHVLMFGGDHFRSYAQDIPLWKYLGLDIIVFFLIIWHACIYLLVKFSKKMFRLCFRYKEKHD
ncbi:UDP-glucuronosyltransferase 1A5-like isoform X2 [Xenia sp. Carnegie-2017]|nr:UDP-glucuronosyltransferase 1A5-like isoform X2 [Xenia sp. Carnegie-2017]